MAGFQLLGMRDFTKMDRELQALFARKKARSGMLRFMYMLPTSLLGAGCREVPVCIEIPENNFCLNS